jgi:hypothetical protein
MPQLTVYVAYNTDGDQGVGDDADEAIERYTDNYSGKYRVVKVTIEAPEVPDFDQEATVTVPEAKAGAVQADPADASDIDPAKEAGA